MDERLVIELVIEPRGRFKQEGIVRVKSLQSRGYTFPIDDR